MKLDHIKERLVLICRAAPKDGYALWALDELKRSRERLGGLYAILLHAPDSAWRRLMYRTLRDWERRANQTKVETSNANQ